jgi:hypothetical protein
MDMRVDEAGEQRDVAEVDDLSVRGDVAADRRDPISLHHDQRVARDLIGRSIEEARRLDSNRLRLGHRRGRDEQEEKCEFSHERESVS